MTSTVQTLRAVPPAGEKASPGPGRRSPRRERPPSVSSLAEIDACALLLQVTEAEWADVIRLSGIDPCGECGGDLRALVHRRALERLLATFRGHSSPRVRLIAGRLWLMHQEPLAQGQHEADRPSVS